MSIEGIKWNMMCISNYLMIDRGRYYLDIKMCIKEFVDHNSIHFSIWYSCFVNSISNNYLSKKSINHFERIDLLGNHEHIFHFSGYSLISKFNMSNRLSMKYNLQSISCKLNKSNYLRHTNQVDKCQCISHCKDKNLDYKYGMKALNKIGNYPSNKWYKYYY